MNDLKSIVTRASDRGLKAGGGYLQQRDRRTQKISPRSYQFYLGAWRLDYW